MSSSLARPILLLAGAIGCGAATTRDDAAAPDGATGADAADATSAGADAGADGPAGCAAGFADCDGVAANGCETSLASAGACGACDAPCAPPHATGTCASGCAILACDAGWGDCDADAANGCETRLSSLEHCGACGHACALPFAVAACGAIGCLVADCEPGRGDCDGDPADGCETDLATSASHCGSCGVACAAPPHAAAACAGQLCGIGACDEGWGDCDGSVTSGCEADVLTSLAHCGGCDQPCDWGPGAISQCDDGGCPWIGCQAGLADCNDDLSDGCEAALASSLAHCGGCDQPCDWGPGAISQCDGGDCPWIGCQAGLADCNDDLSDGCEAPQASCVCGPADSVPCYTGPAGTEGVGVCQAGHRDCLPGGAGWTGCLDQVVPSSELNDNGLDDDCSGSADDIDGDGWRPADGDCCDHPLDGCLDPERVNPGAFDAPDNDLDDDCSGGIDDPPPADCAASADFVAVTAGDLAGAMDLCQTTAAAPPPAERRWGLIEAELLHADGDGPPPANEQVGVLEALGVVAPQVGDTMAALSSGTARDADDPDRVEPNGGWSDYSSAAEAPASYLAAHGGELQTAPGCPAGATTASDSALLRLHVRVPTNALGFSFKFRFFSAEYPEWICTYYNDFFLALLDSGAAGLPADGNISFDSAGNPVSVNNAFFTVCDGCADGDADLAGTGYAAPDAGATAWLVTSAPVVPGEVIVLDLHIWDTSDHLYDSLVLLDGFAWLLDPTEVGTERW